MSLNSTSNDALLISLGVERDGDIYKVNSTSHITLVLKNLTEEINKLRTSQSTISEQPKKSEISKNIDELRKASLDILFTEYEKQYDEFNASSESKKIDPKAIEAGFKSNQEGLKAYIEYRQKEEGLNPNQYSPLNSDVKKLAQDYVEAHNQGLAASKKLSRDEFEKALISGHDEHSKKIDFDTSFNLPLNAVIISHSDCIEQLKSPKKEDSFLSQASSKIEQSFGDISKSFQNINADNYWGTESWTAIGNGLKFNSNSLSHSSLPATLSEFVNSINNFKAPGSIPFFETPPQWSQNSSASNLHQHDWLNSVVNQSTSFVTSSFSRFFAPEKQEPSKEGDEDIKEQMQQRIKKSLAERLTAPHQTKPSSPEEALKSAINASQSAHNEAHKAMMKATAERRRASSPAKTLSAPMKRTSSAHPAPARAAPTPAPISRANSVPSQKPRPQDPRIAFFGKAAENHSANLEKDRRPNANGPKKSSASTLRPPLTK